MGKKRKQLSHAEIWDDSALVQSWDEALAEYKLYHSIHARGERVEDVIKDVEAGSKEADTNGTNITQSELPLQTNDTMSEELEDGELEEEAENGQVVTNGDSTQKAHEFSSSMPEQMQPPFKPSVAKGKQPMPDAILGSVQDEALKNLMMSWYYAGYYTGLYEGQQQAQSGIPK
ncbi:hypothetical protein JMJ35_002825 [Cladonia borealis]|uniref:Survival Motor Neuron Gemin2-binding domain-containing protein n=1 Tax=Cladonia borealis TaxID=184061 RepID=A0AA39R6H3_9LECA|nr:hypothetical protein JMJ35_002825 [Cladonia borealis]